MSINDGVLGRDDGNVIRDTGASALPEHLRKGEHTVTLEPSVLRSRSVVRIDNGTSDCGDRAANTDATLGGDLVGFFFWDGAFCNHNHAYQTVVSFALGWMEELGDNPVLRAELRYKDELKTAFLEIDGEDVSADPSHGCVARVGMAPPDWEARWGTTDLIASGETDADPVGNGRDAAGEIRWNVTRDIQWARLQPHTWHGFMLHGGREDLETEVEHGCVSRLSNLRLVVTYVIL